MDVYIFGTPNMPMAFFGVRCAPGSYSFFVDVTGQFVLKSLCTGASPFIKNSHPLKPGISYAKENS